MHFLLSYLLILPLNISLFLSSFFLLLFYLPLSLSLSLFLFLFLSLFLSLSLSLYFYLYLNVFFFLFLLSSGIGCHLVSLLKLEKFLFEIQKVGFDFVARVSCFSVLGLPFGETLLQFNDKLLFDFNLCVGFYQ